MQKRNKFLTVRNRSGQKAIWIGCYGFGNLNAIRTGGRGFTSELDKKYRLEKKRSDVIGSRKSSPQIPPRQSGDKAMGA